MSPLLSWFVVKFSFRASFFFHNAVIHTCCFPSIFILFVSEFCLRPRCIFRFACISRRGGRGKRVGGAASEYRYQGNSTNPPSSNLRFKSCLVPYWTIPSEYRYFFNLSIFQLTKERVSQIKFLSYFPQIFTRQVFDISFGLQHSFLPHSNLSPGLHPPSFFASLSHPILPSSHSSLSLLAYLLKGYSSNCSSVIYEPISLPCISHDIRYNSSSLYSQQSRLTCLSRQLVLNRAILLQMDAYWSLISVQMPRLDVWPNHHLRRQWLYSCGRGD